MPRNEDLELIRAEPARDCQQYYMRIQNDRIIDMQLREQQEAVRRKRNVAIGVGAGAVGAGIVGAGATGIATAILMGFAALFGLFMLCCLLMFI